MSNLLGAAVRWSAIFALFLLFCLTAPPAFLLRLTGIAVFNVADWSWETAKRLRREIG